MPINPGQDESQSDWMSRCVPEMMGTGPDARDQDQAVAICMDIWRQDHPEDAYRGGRPRRRPAASTRQLSPRDDETYSDWMDRCSDETGDESYCQYLWDEERGHAPGGRRRQAPPPNQDETHDDFMDRCTTALMAENDGMDEADAQRMCEVAWGGEAGARPAIVKSTVAPVHDMMFTLSDETVDRYGDIVSADGWELDSFRKNPIALFGHNHDFPIGRWLDLHVADGALRGTLTLAPKKASARIDEIRTLIEAGILKAVSVGFRSLVRPAELKDEKGEWTGGLRFLKHELLECSVVPVPANPNALAIAKALRISPATIDLAFAEPGDRRELVRGRAITGEVAVISRPRAMSLSQRIEDAQNRRTALCDRLTEHLRNIDDANPSDAEDAITLELNRQIAQASRHLATLEDAERALTPAGLQEIIPPGDDPPERSRLPARGRALTLSASQIGVQRLDGSVRYRPSPRAVSLKRRKELDPVDYLVRNGVITLFAHRLRKSVDEVRVMLYGDDEMTKAAFTYVQKAATAPAMTDVPGWAEELVTQIQGDFMAPLMPTAVFPQLAGLGLSLDFGRAGRIAIPTRARTPTIAGAFIGEGQPIPVKQGMFTAQIITPKKLGVITVMTREIEDHSIPAIEALLRDAISEDTGVSIDSVLLDGTTATTIRPPGIRNGAQEITPTTAGAESIVFNRMVMDIRKLRAALIGATFGNVRSPCWIMNPIRADAIALTPAPGTGLFPFRDEIRAGSLEGWPLFDSTTVDPSQMIAVDAADFVTAGQGAPVFEVSDQATLHMDDDPLPIVDGGTPAAPVRSLWQTDSYALRLIMRLNWLMRRPMVAWMPGITW